MKGVKILFGILFIVFSVYACTPVREVGMQTEPVVQADYRVTELFGPKMKIAVAEFSNSTPYSQRRLGQSISSILVTELSRTNRFTILERDQIESILGEVNLSMSGLSQDVYGDFELIGADYLIVGDVTSFAVATEGHRSIASRSRTQTANVSVDLRIIDVRTGEIILSETGSGNAMKRTTEVLGMGGTAGYDEGLEQDAFRSSVSSVMENIIAVLDDREWLCDVIEIDGGALYINAGQRSNLKIGDSLRLYKQGEPLRDRSGRILAFREEYLGDAVVVSFLGEDVSVLNTNIAEGLLAMPIIGKFNK